MSAIGRPKGKPTIDWAQARLAYTSDSKQSYASVAQTFGVASKTVQERATNEGWPEIRKNLITRVSETAESNLVEQKIEANKRHSLAARNMQALAALELQIAYKQTQAWITDKGDDARIGRDSDAISPFNMKLILDSLKLGIDLERVTLGLPNTVVNNQVTGIDGEKLFEETNINELSELLAKTISAISQGDTANSSK